MTDKTFSTLSVELTTSLPKQVKKDMGIFFTPPVLIKSLLEHVPITTESIILEPSCGSCEFMTFIDDHYTYRQMTGVEWNQTIFNRIQGIGYMGDVQLIHSDFLRINREDVGCPTVIVGNPPFLVIPKETVPERFQPYLSGRPNLFCLFLLHALDLLAEEGHLAFVVPTSFLNSLYYEQVRKRIMEVATIEKLFTLKDDTFLDTKQETAGFVLRKRRLPTSTSGPPPPPSNYTITIAGHLYFTTQKQELETLLEGSTTLSRMGLSVKTGTIVWNQHKDKLTDDPTETLLVYNTNIKENRFNLMEFQNEEKQQYIELDETVEPLTTPVIAVNRGNGNSSYRLTYCLLELDQPYVLENHINYIYQDEDEVDMDLFEQVLESFQDERTQRFISIFLGNNGMSKTELEQVLPIY